MMTRGATTARLIVADWRTLAADKVSALYYAETQRWSSTLEWDTSKDWEEVERGRQLGTVQGIVVTDEGGAVQGWSYYLLQDRSLQVGLFNAASDNVAQLMLDRIFSPDNRLAVDTITFFAFNDAQGFPAILRQRGLSVDRYWYLARDLERQAPARIPDMRPWRVDDLQATADLLSRAYEGADEARAFAPRGTAAEWRQYIEQLTTRTGCGTLLTDVCGAIPGGPNRLIGVALVTRIGEGVAHLAQLAVDPSMSGRGVGRQLLEFICATASQAGYGRMTLFVGGRNSRARSLYDSSRFEMRGSFVSAGTLQPRRATGVAPGAAGGGFRR